MTSRRTKNAQGWMDGAAQVVIGAATLLAIAMALGGSHESRAASGFRQAMASYEAGQWPQAYEELARLADAGDAPSARVASMMVRQGPALFGQRFDVSAEQLARWDEAMRGRAAAHRVPVAFHPEGPAAKSSPLRTNVATAEVSEP